MSSHDLSICGASKETHISRHSLLSCRTARCVPFFCKVMPCSRSSQVSDYVRQVKIFRSSILKCVSTGQKPALIFMEFAGSIVSVLLGDAQWIMEFGRSMNCALLMIKSPLCVFFFQWSLAFRLKMCRSLV